MSRLHELIQDIFGPNGWLVHNGGHHLPEQLKYALAVSDWLTGRSEMPLALLEADTGTGKTLGYLFPVVLQWTLTGKRAVVATHTINLQNQMISGDLEIVERYLVESDLSLPKVKQRLGMRHFVDPHRVASIASESPDSPDLAALLHWAIDSADHGTGMIDEWLQLYGPLPEGVTDSMICVTPSSTPDCNAALEAQREESLDADIVVTSHMMVLLEAYWGRNILGLDAESMEYLIFDEADQIPSSIESLANKRIQPRYVIRALEALLGKGSHSLDKHILGSMKAIGSLDRELEVLGQDKHGREVVVDDPETTSPQAAEILNGLKAECADIEKRIRRSHLAKQKDQGNVHEALEVLGWVTNFNDGDKSADFGVHAIAWSPVLRIPSLLFQRANPGLSVSNLWRKMDLKVCFTSATLGGTNAYKDHERFIPLKRQLGIARGLIGKEAQLSPRQFGTVRFVLADPSVPSPIARQMDDNTSFRKEWLRYTADMVKAASATGPTLVLTASYQEALNLGKLLVSFKPIIHQYGQSLADSISRLQASESQVLISPSAWQGTSIRDTENNQLLVNLVISRIPFSPPNVTAERLMEILAQRLGNVTPSKASAYERLRKREEALIKLRQGFGRVIRHKDDEATIWIADPRFPRPGETGSNTYFRGAISSRFVPAYEDATVFKPGGELHKAKVEAPSVVKEFMQL